MRIPYKSTITLLFFLCITAGNQSTALTGAQNSLSTQLNEVDAFSKSEENLKDKLIFSHILSPEVKTIVLDAGHGGKDRGCKGIHPDVKEKEIALAVTLKLGNYIESYFPNVNVIYTRKEDKFVTLNRRARIANEAEADLFISIHCNYIRNRPDVKGSETYVMGLHTADHNLNVAMRENSAITLEDNFKRGYQGYNPDSPESHIMLSMYQNAYLERSILFAELVEQQIPKSSNGKHSSRGVRQAGFLVLKATAMPSVLVESGYLSHEQDEAFLKTKEGQKDVAFAIFKAFGIYKNVIEGTDDGEFKLAAIAEVEVEPAKEEEVKPVVETPKSPERTNVKPNTKKKAIVEKPTPPQPKTETTTDNSGLTYMVQLAATPIPVDLPNSKYADWADQIISKKEGDLIKYLIPVGKDKKNASAKLKEVRASGHPKVFLSVYDADKRVKILYN